MIGLRLAEVDPRFGYVTNGFISVLSAENFFKLSGILVLLLARVSIRQRA